MSALSSRIRYAWFVYAATTAILAVSCSIQPTRLGIELTAGHTPPRTDTSTSTSRPTTTPYVVATPDATATVTSFVTATQGADATSVAKKDCIESLQANTRDLSLADGLVASGSWGSITGIGVLGSNGWTAPKYLQEFAPIDRPRLPLVSPDGKLLSSLILEGADGLVNLDLTVIDPREATPRTLALEHIQISSLDQVRWINNTQIAIGLEPQGTTFEWVVWNPRTSEKTTLTFTAPDMGRALRFFDLWPQIDPTLRRVIYPCEDCDGDEYRVRDLTSGDLLWSIDLGEEPGFRAPAVWSPDGMYVAVAGARNFVPNGLWIFDEHGQEVLHLSLSHPGSVLSAANLKWSPEGNYLAFSRGTGESPISTQTSLNLLSIGDGELTDLCIDLDDYFWSPDGTKIAVVRRADPKTNERGLAIVELGTSLAHHISDPDQHVVHGWLISGFP
jgi:hypothetical protein